MQVPLIINQQRNTMKARAAVLIVLFVFLCAGAYSQIFTSLKGHVQFSSKAPEENIEANNHSVAAQLIYAAATGQFIIPVKSFKFKSALMEEHFNENYMESDRYPKATYKYEIPGMDKVNLQVPGQYKVLTKGVLTIKSTVKQIEVWGKIMVLDDHSIRLEADFVIKPADYEIEIPSLLGRKIAKLIEVQVIATLLKQ